MPGIILTILKTIGIILLILITLILVITSLVLFVPVRYSARGCYSADYKLKAKFTWLLHILSVNADLSDTHAPQLIIRILGIPVYDSGRSSGKSGAKKDKNDTEKNNTEIQAASTNSNSENDSATNVEKESSSERKIHKRQNEYDEKNESIDDNNTSKDSSIINLLFDKIIYFIRNIKRFFLNIKYTFQKIYGKIVDIKNNIHYYCDLLSQDTTKAAFGACKKQLHRIFRNLRPKQWHVYLHIGMEDPAAMGQILGIWGMLYPLHEGHIELEPDFNHFIIEGNFSLKGRITVYVYLWTAYIILFDKNIKHLKKCLLREEG